MPAVRTASIALSIVLGAASAARADRFEQSVKDAAPSGLLAGVARADITPPVGIAQLNWGSQTHVEAAGIDPTGMTATALVVSDGKQQFAMVAIDALGLEGLEQAREQAASRTGIPVEHIRLAASHTHAGPQISRVRGPAGTDYDSYEPVFQAHQRAVADKIAGAILEAARRLRPVHVYGMHGTGSININRRVRAQGDLPAAVGRNPDGFVDRDLAVVRIDEADGRPYAVLVNYACHGTVLGFENEWISPDWIGAMRRTLEAALPGAMCLFFQGAAGNQGPVEGFTGDLAVAHRLGTILGLEAAALAWRVDTVRRAPRFEGFVESAAYQARQPWRVLGPRDGTLRFAASTVKAARRRYSEEDIRHMQAQVREAEARLEAAKRSSDAWRTHQAHARLRRVSELLKKWQLPYEPSPIAVDLQALRIGEVAIVAMPGEPFAEIGAAVKKSSPFPVTLFCGYSSGAGGSYMPVAEEYRFGGYEVEITPYAPEAAELIIAEAAALLRRLR